MQLSRGMNKFLEHLSLVVKCLEVTIFPNFSVALKTSSSVRIQEASQYRRLDRPSDLLSYHHAHNHRHRESHFNQNVQLGFHEKITCIIEDM